MLLMGAHLALCWTLRWQASSSQAPWNGIRKITAPKYLHPAPGQPWLFHQVCHQSCVAERLQQLALLGASAQLHAGSGSAF